MHLERQNGQFPLHGGACLQLLCHDRQGDKQKVSPCSFGGRIHAQRGCGKPLGQPVPLPKECQKTIGNILSKFSWTSVTPPPKEYPATPRCCGDGRGLSPGAIEKLYVTMVATDARVPPFSEESPWDLLRGSLGFVLPATPYKTEFQKIPKERTHKQTNKQRVEKPCEVWMATWWMGLYLSKFPKRHIAWSNAPVVGKLDLGKLRKELREQMTHSIRTTKSYIAKSDGRKRFTGSRHLRSSQWGPLLAEGVLKSSSL